ncbi:MAG: radical SAM family heme chaperone HemW, partial [Alphaproteobacteria bacterium]
MTEAPPLAVYVHWPYCARICPYCDFNVVRDRGQAEQAALADAIVRDLSGQARLIGPRKLTSVFFGGGTPSLMRPEWAARIVEAAQRLWPTDEPVEVTLEANPTDAEAGRFRAFAQAGVTRLSLGVQSLDDAALKFLGRNHSAAEARRAAEMAGATFPRLSIDFIYALPGQTVEHWRASLREAIALGPEHLSPYQLTIEAGTAFDRAVRRKVIEPLDDEASADLFELTQEVLTAAGFQAYEVSNHARTHEARSVHNMAYWRGWDYLGAGPGAHGRLAAEAGRLATEGETRVVDYIASVDETGIGCREPQTLKPRQYALERLLLGLRGHEGVPLADIAPLKITP